jgi:LPXTG-site transpeptidase (sortase) family protein
MLRMVFRRAVTAVISLAAALAVLVGAGAVEALRPLPSITHTASDPPSLGRICPGDTIARVSVPRLGYEAAVREGADAETLAHGPGHVPGTALPGEEFGRKHAVIAVARDNGSKFASDLAIGDRIELRTPFGLRAYRVVGRRTVKVEDLRIEPTEEPTLTFIAPYPVDPVGPAPLRLAVRAEPIPEAVPAGRERSDTRSLTRSTGRNIRLGGAVVSIALPAGR